MTQVKLLVLVFTGLLLSGCGQSVKQSELDESLATWQNLKAQNGDHYRYETSFASWTGFSSTTTLTVKAGRVTARAYEATYFDQDKTETTETWTEQGSEVGSHEAGAEPRTVDELYGVCRSEVLMQSSAENEFYLEFRGDGVLKDCYYRPKNCADDCLMGVNISGLEFLPAKPD